MAGAPVAVVDIGSNSVRLVIYDRLCRSPATLFNEKALCAIGGTWFRPAGSTTRAARRRSPPSNGFARSRGALGIARVEAVATAAVRDAKNGNEFVARARDALGSPIKMLTGEEEARLATEGVLAAIPDADGVVGDLGGGSLELAFVSGGKQSEGVTLPFGPLRLMDVSDGKVERARDMVDQGLEKLPGLDKLKGKALYAVGGVWRNIARIHMEDQQHPIRVLHHYEMSRDKAVTFTQFVSAACRASRLRRRPARRGGALKPSPTAPLSWSGCSRRRSSIGSWCRRSACARACCSRNWRRRSAPSAADHRFPDRRLSERPGRRAEPAPAA